MRKAVKAQATITAAFRVGRSRSRLEMRVTKASPLLLELPPPPAASPDTGDTAGASRLLAEATPCPAHRRRWRGAPRPEHGGRQCSPGG